LILAGDSAGGNLAACMAHKCRDEQIKIAAQILIYPWVDGKLNNPSISPKWRGVYAHSRYHVMVSGAVHPRPKRLLQSSCFANLSTKFCTDLAPAFILTATFDPLIDDGLFYAQKLKEAGNDSAILRI
jgi:acetyl esterase